MLKTFFLARIREASTWRGIVLFLTAAGVPIAPAAADAIISAGLAMAGLIGVFAPDAGGAEK